MTTFPILNKHYSGGILDEFWQYFKENLFRQKYKSWIMVCYQFQKQKGSQNYRKSLRSSLFSWAVLSCVRRIKILDTAWVNP